MERNSGQMKKIFRKFRKVKVLIIGLIVLVLVLVAVSLRIHDPEPYFKLQAYADMRAVEFEEVTIGDLSGDGGLVDPLLRCGFDRQEMVPGPEGGFPDGVPLAGYGERRGAAAEGVLDPVYISCLSFDRGGVRWLFLGMDALIVPRPVADRLMEYCVEEYQIPPSHVFFSASHTHSGPGGWAEGPIGEIFAGDYNPEVIEAWVELASRTIDRSLSADLPVSGLRHFSFDGGQYIRNRLHGADGLVYSAFEGVRIMRGGGKDVVIGVFGAHATSIPAENLSFSGDYAGYWRRHVETNENIYAVFAGGGMGSQTYRMPDGETLTVMDSVTAKAEYLGHALGAATATAMKNAAIDEDMTLAGVHIDVALPSLQIRLNDHLILNPYISNRLLERPETTFFKGMRIGRTIFIGMPADYSGELVQEFTSRLTSTVPNDDGGQVERVSLRPVVTSFNGDYTGYVVPTRYFYYNAYESRVMSFYGYGMAGLCQYAMGRIYSGLSGGINGAE